MNLPQLLSVCFLSIACSACAPSSTTETPNDTLEDAGNGQSDGNNPQTGTNEPSPATVPLTELVNKTWVLTHYQHNDGLKLEVAAQRSGQFTVQLVLADQPDGSNLQSVKGKVDCNGYSGYYVFEQDILRLFNTTASEAACDGALEPPTPLFERFIFGLDGGTMVSLENAQLVLTTGANERLYFSTDQSVEYAQIKSGDLAFTEDLTFNQPRLQVLRSQAQLNELYYNYLVPPCPACEQEPAPVVDFSAAIVVFVAHEIVSSGGYDIAVTSVEVSNAGLQVNVLKRSPGDNCGVDDAFTGPYRMYQINGTFEEVNFMESSVQSPACSF